MRENCRDCEKRIDHQWKIKTYCKECTYKRKRKKDKKYQKNRRKRLKGYKTKEYKEYCKKYPEKVKAQQTLNRAIQSKKITRSPCYKCGETYRIHGHHPNYNEPLKVIWVCTLHHKELH